MTPTAPPGACKPTVLHNIDWPTYTRFLRLFADNRFRHTYDRGRLEIMSPIYFEHDNPAYVLGRFVNVLTDELNLNLRAGRCVTLRYRKKQRGLEPDNCYWIANAPRMRGKKGRIDLRTDPPPDLAVEVEVSRTVLKRLGIYAALGVPEIWRFRKKAITFHILRDKKYCVEPKSLAFLHLASADLTPFAAQLGDTDDTGLVRQLREWVKQQIAVWHAASG